VANQSVDHHDVGLLHGWHLNHARVPVPPPPEVGPKLDAEICRRIWNLPEALRLDRIYRNRQYWHDFLAWEHTAYQSWKAYAVDEFPLDEEDEDNEDYHVIIEEADEAM
jgi:hypothetical protein